MTSNTQTLDIRRFDTLGGANHGWLNAKHHFSFSGYQDPDRMGWGRIRVWNDDLIAPHTGFAPHGHEDMEIITYVRSGAITHEDSLGNKGRTEAGDVQVMSAGTGIRHSEYNHEPQETAIVQIWVIPDQTGEAPSRGAKPFPKADRAGSWQILASGQADDDALPIRADARVLGATVKAGDSLDYLLEDGRHAYLVPATGRITVEGETVNARDGLALRPGRYRFTAQEEAELILVDAR
jgi:quercetin 2,3-dioxygenase